MTEEDGIRSLTDRLMLPHEVCPSLAVLCKHLRFHITSRIKRSTASNICDHSRSHARDFISVHACGLKHHIEIRRGLKGKQRSALKLFSASAIVAITTRS